MEINSDFNQRVVVHANQLEWKDSPMPGVKRRMLDRVGDEVARATTIVKYEPKSQFSSHVHSGGEEFIVIEGVFQDEHGDFPVGSYIRNPPQSSHTPGSEPGCTIFVKLWQFDPDDRKEVKLDMDSVTSLTDKQNEGVSITPLHRDEREEVTMQKWSPGVKVSMDVPGGGEFFVLEGGFNENEDKLEQHDWLRIPVNGRLDATAGEKGAKVWIKTGHLRFIDISGHEK